MALQREQIGVNANGSPRYRYFGADHIVQTAPDHFGPVELPDGTVVDVTPEVVEVPSHLHALQLAAHLEGRDASQVTDEHVQRVVDGHDEPLGDVPAREGDGS